MCLEKKILRYNIDAFQTLKLQLTKWRVHHIILVVRVFYITRRGEIVKRHNHTETDRVVWLVYVIQYTADELGMSVTDTAELLAQHGFIEKTLNGYAAFHTQGFEYMAEFLKGELYKVRET